jgi:enterochelin esterase-like enzyme
LITVLTRRTLLIGGAAVTAAAAAGVGVIKLAEAGVLPGSATIDAYLARCDIPVPAPSHAPGPKTTGKFDSRLRRRTVDFTIAYPPGSRVGAALPVCLVLHGYGANQSTALTIGNYPAYLADAVADGVPPFALASVDGGDGYWHPHPHDDPLGMLFDEFLPLLAARGLRTARLAVLGFSMGGFGALLCGLTAPTRFVSIAASSPAFWPSYADAQHVNKGAFSSAAEWTRYGNLLGRATDIGKLPVEINVGESDSFAPVIRELRDRLPDPSVVRISKGCHDESYWRSQAPAQLHTIGTALATT